MANDFQLAPFPSSHSRNSLTPAQHAALIDKIASCVLLTIQQPADKRDSQATRKFIATYAKDAALLTLESLIWGTDVAKTEGERIVKKRTLILAEKVASTAGFDAQTLIDLAIVYAQTNITHVRRIYEDSFAQSPTLALSFESEVIPAFIHMLSPEHMQGLYGLRKTIHCICTVVHASPPGVVHAFARSKDFILALAKTYEHTLKTLATSYGGVSVLARSEARASSEPKREIDEWEKLWIECKVGLVDTFHIVLSSLLHRISTSSGATLANESERAFDIMFSLLEVSPSESSDGQNPTPFLNQSLLADYQHAYSLSQTLTSSLKHAPERDARLDLLENTLAVFDAQNMSDSGEKSPGVLKLVIRSSGVAPGVKYDPVSHYGLASAPADPPTSSKGKGKAKATPPVDEDPELDVKVVQVLDILPDNDPSYIRALLASPTHSFRGNAEKVIEALLEGIAPSAEEILSTQETGEISTSGAADHPQDDISNYVNSRKNAFDEDEVDMSSVRIGKTKNDADTLLHDKSFMDEMKADILRRIEEFEISDAEMDEVYAEAEIDDAFDTVSNIRVLGDGEESGGDDDETDDEDGTPGKQSPEMICELAYIKDPKVFERDANTRRSKERKQLKELTGWDDGQIEGWRIMLEKDPKKKEQVLQKHEFAGNRASNIVLPTPQASGSGQGRGRGGRGGGRGRGRGGGRGGGGGDGGGGGGDARQRAWKDKNKSSQGNHNRKRGHDKKMARAGPPPA